MKKFRTKSTYLMLVVVFLASLVLVTPAYAAGITVNSSADTTADDGTCTLREAIANANSDSQLYATSGECAAGSGSDSISFNSSLSGATINLASQLAILEDVTIDGSSLASKITISGGDSTRVFYVGSAATTILDTLIVTQGHVEGCCGAGLLNDGTLTITNSLFSANINNNGTGGAIMNTASGTLTVTSSTISGNSASNGGGIGNYNQMTIMNSTLSANTSGDAGGSIFSEGAAATLTVTNSTFSGNTASTNGFGSGGGIFSSGALTVKNSTFSGNSAAYDAGGIAQDNGTLNFSNTIIANSVGGDCYKASATGVNLNNLVEDGSCANIPHDPNLGPLANNGGPTQTFALLANSPAIDAGDDTTCAASPVNNLDQNGTTRPNGGHCDIGAYEYVDTTAPSITVFNVPASPTSLDIPITTFTVSEDAILTGYLITESATPPAFGDSGWTASAPTTYPVASMGSYTLYPWAKDAAGHVSAVFGSPASVNITCLTPITVTSNADSGPGTLRQAIADACVGDLNNISMIDFDSALSGETIHLASELTIAKNMTIDGSALTSPLTLSGEDTVRVFSITGGSPGLTVTLDSLIVTKGATSGHGAGLFMEQGMHVTIKNSTFSDNHAGGRGGGIGNQGALTLINSTVSGNSAASTNGGGGISNESGLTMTNSTISDNHATGATASGGGLFNTGGATITNSTIFGNSSNVYGGGISTTANLTITNSTITGNSAAVTGGLEVDGNKTHLWNTLIANNTSTTINSLIHNDCSDTSDYPAQPTPDGDGIITNVNNLIEDGSCSPSLSGDPNLGPLTDNGGSTQTMALLPGSYAINAGNDSVCAASPINGLDQRGVTRPQGHHCDIGAYEYDALGGPDTVGVFRPSNGALYLRNSNTTGFANVAINYGLAGDYPVVGDWDGNGTDTIGVYRNGVFYLRNSNTLGIANITVAFGSPGDQPIAGDWNNDGFDTIGVYRSSTGTFFLRNTNTPGTPDLTFSLGNAGDVGIAGDWNGDGTDTTGVFRPSNGMIFLKNTNATGFANIALNYGLPGDQPMVGDWDSNGIDTIGVYRNARFYLRNFNTNGYANIILDLGNLGDMPIAGDWDGKP